MHRDTVAWVVVTPETDFVITASVDGVVKFWKKVAEGIEFVKEFRAHVGEVRAVSASRDGRAFASAGGSGTDRSVKVWDVVTFGELGDPGKRE
jgi:peptidylprolyl isomerase domain and WD repeat-containing protein 1